MSNNLKLEPEKLYYVKKQNGEICIRKTYLYSSIKTERYVLFVDFDDEDIIEVISPVPSYEELQAEINRLRETLKNICITAKRGKSSQLFTPETALQYSNSTAKLALGLIRSIDSLNKSAIARDLEEMIEKTRKVLERKDHKNEV